MGAVDTTYTFTATDTITSSKMNNIIDQTTITTNAIIGTTLEVVSGKLKIRSQGITSNEMGVNAVVTAAITDSNVTTAKIADTNVTTAKIADTNVTQAKLAPNVAGNGPAFLAYLNVNQAITDNSSDTIVTLDAKSFDTASCFNTSTYRFTPDVAGYYQINVTAQIDSQLTGALGTTFIAIVKNNSEERFDVSIINTVSVLNSYQASGSVLIYMNGTTDYLWMSCKLAPGAVTNAVIIGGVSRTRMSGFLARSA